MKIGETLAGGQNVQEALAVLANALNAGQKKPEASINENDVARIAKKLIETHISKPISVTIKDTTTTIPAGEHRHKIFQTVLKAVVCGNVAIVGAAGSGNEGKILVDLKQAGEVLDLDRMAFCLVNPAFHRRFKFGVLENIPRLASHRGTYGRSGELSESDKQELEPTVYIYRTSDNYANRAHALQNVSNFFINQLEKAGITLPEGNTYD